MAYNPLPIIAVIAVSVAFQALVYGDQLLAEAAPDIEQPSSGGIFAAFDGIVAIVQSIFAVVGFILESIVFPFPDAWWPIRFVGGTIQTTGLVWSIATLVRGN